ncbi:MAG TPA: hypothetical protein VM709_05195, partial [Candidatus Sulfotelmatobacter sp.]|nr:hypothetical protein [Candidatus Sulfotelmatobacter sp.]
LYFHDVHDHFAVSVAAHPLGGAWHNPGKTPIISEPQLTRYALLGRGNTREPSHTRFREAYIPSCSKPCRLL